MVNLFDRLILARKTRTDDLWKQLEAERDQLRTERDQLQAKNAVLHKMNGTLAKTARDWESFSQNAWTTAVKSEGKALEELDEAQGDERWLWEGEKRAYRNMQASMQVIGRSLGIHLEKPL
jgi:hypothetical protein